MYPGSFDPVTYGHIDIIERAAKVADMLIVAVLNNAAKKNLFNIDERVEMLKEAVSAFENVEVASFSGLLATYAEIRGVNIIIKGLRNENDFQSEFQQALINRELSGGLETLFIPSSTGHIYISSSAVKEIIMHGGDISKMAPPHVTYKLNEKYK
jgi:pantetheine-phosphate adenylyltransferase